MAAGPSPGFCADYRSFVHAHPDATLWHDPDFLEALAPVGARGGYCGVVLRDGGGAVTAAVPVYRKRRVDGVVATVPPLARYADPLTALPHGRGGEAQAVDVLRAAWRDCVSADHVLSPRAAHLAGALRVSCPGLGVRERDTYVVSLDDGLEAAHRRMSRSKRKRLRKAGAYWRTATIGLGAECRDVLAAPFRRQGLAVPYDEAVLSALAVALAPRGGFRIDAALHPDGTLGAAALVIADEGTAYALLSGSTDAARAHDGGSYALWRNVTAAAELGCRRLDFLGSDLPGPAQNRRDLGGVRETYVRVWLDRRWWTRAWRGRVLRTAVRRT